MDKYNFIENILNNPKLTLSQRESIILLSQKEIVKDHQVIRNIEERLVKLEEKVVNDTQDIKKESQLSEKKQNIPNLPKYKSPKELYQFLFKYNQNPILKYTCHDISLGDLAEINENCKMKNYDFQIHLEKIKTEFEDFIKKYKYISSNTQALIRGYLTGKNYEGNELEKGWSSKQVKINWSSAKVLEWTQENKGLPPNLNTDELMEKENTGFELDKPIKSPIVESPVQNFTQLVLYFKSLFHIKGGSQSLNKILKRVNEDKKWNKKVEFIMDNKCFPENINLFTDVDKLIQAYNKMIQLILEQQENKEKPIVKLSFKEEENKITLSIHHINGIYNKTIQNTLERFGTTYTELIKNQINGLCNLYLKANFGNDKYAKINLWNGEQMKSEKIVRFEGVEHIFEFIKN